MLNSDYFSILLVNKFADYWSQVWNRIKLFFVIVFYLILTGMYTLHSYESIKQLVMSYNIEIFNNENIKKEKEEIMMKKNIENLESKTMNISNPPVRHTII